MMTLLRRTKVYLFVCLLLPAVTPQASFAQQCDQTLSVGADIVSAIANAPNGSTICLKSGNYGRVNFTNLNRTGFVTVRSATGVDAQLSIGEIYDTEFIKFDSLTFGAVHVRECSTNIEFWNSTWLPNGEGLSFNYSMPCSQPNMRLVVDNCTFDRLQSTGAEGRLSARKVSGLTIRNSRFSGSPASNASDGIQIYDDSRNVTIGPGNVFRDILQSQCGAVHCDAIQLYGSSNTSIVGNYFVNSTVHIGIYDGGSPDTIIRNNVFDTSPDGQALQIGGVRGMLMEHNTFRNVTLGIGTKFANTPHSGWIVQNNIFDKALFTASGDQPGCGSDCILRYNLKSNGGTTSPTGTNNIRGTAVYLGAKTPDRSAPNDWSTWQLASGSPGKNAASDGKDVGSNYFGQGSVPDPTPTPTPTPTPDPSPTPPAPPTNLRVVSPEA